MKKLKVNVVLLVQDLTGQKAPRWSKLEDGLTPHHDFLPHVIRKNEGQGKEKFGGKTCTADKFGLTHLSNLVPEMSQPLTQVPYVFQEPPFKAPKSSSLQRRPKYRLFWGVPGFSL